MIQENWKTLCDMLIQNKSEDEFETFIDRIVSEARKEEKARAEKAEGELKVIKARIEAVEELATIENGHFVAECRWNAGYNTGIFDCKEIIKQIGGEK